MSDESRTRDGRFAPGHSGNPNPRHPTRTQIQGFFLANEWRARRALLRSLDSDNGPTRNQAIDQVYNRILGKPTQHIEQQTTDLTMAHFLALTAGEAPPILEASAERPPSEPLELFAWGGVDAPEVDPPPPPIPEWD